MALLPVRRILRRTYYMTHVMIIGGAANDFCVGEIWVIGCEGFAIE
jgi:hypothetical protein